MIPVMWNPNTVTKFSANDDSNSVSMEFTAKTSNMPVGNFSRVTKTLRPLSPSRPYLSTSGWGYRSWEQRNISAVSCSVRATAGTRFVCSTVHFISDKRTHYFCTTVCIRGAVQLKGEEPLLRRLQSLSWSRNSLAFIEPETAVLRRPHTTFH
jgi:hypothetical protein